MKLNPINNNLNFNGMIERELTVKQEHGVHMLPAGCFAKLSKTAPYDVYIVRNNVESNVHRSMISIMALELQQGEKIKIKVADDYPLPLLNALVACLSAPLPEQSRKITNDYLSNHK